MSRTHLLGTFGLLICTSSILSYPAFADHAVVTPQVISGIATTQDGRPLSDAVLFIGDFPTVHGVGTSLDQDPSAVVTDRAGHFTWKLTAEFSDVGQSFDYSCWMLAGISGGGQACLRLPAANFDDPNHFVVQCATAKCKTHWSGTSPGSTLLVAAPATGNVEIEVRGPDGQPVRGKSIEAFVAGSPGFAEGAVVFTSKTDSQGRLSMRWFNRLLRLEVMVPGIGFGSTGTFQVIPGQEMHPEVPPVAPLATISGSLAAGTSPTAGAVLSLADDNDTVHSWCDRTTTIDRNGRWTFNDVLPGQYRVELCSGVNATQYADIDVDSGQHITNLVLKTSEPFRSLAAGFVPNFNQNPYVMGTIRARGIVTDATGNPIAGAKVYESHLTFFSGQIFENVQSTETNADGKYLLQYPAELDGSTGFQLVVSKEGFAPDAVSLNASISESGGKRSFDDITNDFRLTESNNGITIHVLQNGKPVAHALVRLKEEDSSHVLASSPSNSAHSSLFASVEHLVSPMQYTDDSGTVKFSWLTPGNWTVYAVDAKTPGDAILDDDQEWRRPTTSPFGIAHGVAIRAGLNNHFTVSIYPQTGVSTFDIQSSDRSNPNMRTLQMKCRPVDDSFGDIVLPWEQGGLGEPETFQSSGIWEVGATYRNVEFDSYTSSREPYYKSSTLIAWSPSFPYPNPRTDLADRFGPGSIQVIMRDASGNPASGSVVVGQSSDSAEYGASTGKDGAAIFPDVIEDKYTLTLSGSREIPLPALGKAGDLFPSDSVLTGAMSYMPQTVTVTSNTQSTVVFPSPLAYIRGKLEVTDSPANYTLSQDGSNEQRAEFRIDSVTGEFVAGPFLPGSVYLDLFREAGDVGGPYRMWRTRLTLSGGRLEHIALIPAGQNKTPGPNDGRAVIMGGESDVKQDDAAKGTVYLPDGVTPAWGARVAVMLPDYSAPIKLAESDAVGKLSFVDKYFTYATWPGPASLGTASDPPVSPGPGPRDPDSPSDPVLVAWLPGSNGGVVVPFVPGQSPKMVLPPAVSVHGKVTAGGQPVALMNSSFRVFAAYQGHGNLNDLLSVDTTPQADGTFELNGLTPGAYIVQAARDGIWLSDPKPLVVSNGSLPDLNLDIPVPGEAIDLTIIDRVGTRLPNAQVEIQRAEGPLAHRLWPKMISADCTGCLHLEGLSAGRQSLNIYSAQCIASDGNPVEPPICTVNIDVPQYQSSRSKRVGVRIKRVQEHL